MKPYFGYKKTLLSTQVHQLPDNTHNNEHSNCINRGKISKNIAFATPGSEPVIPFSKPN